jgi:cytochrome P450
VIPEGTIVVANIYHMLNDPAAYDNPSEFIPERHIKDGKIDKDVLDPYAVFGFGRR